MGSSAVVVSGFQLGFGSALLTVVLERFAKLGGYSWELIRRIWGMDKELRKLQRALSKIQVLVEYMECSSINLFGGSNAWQMWYEDLRKVAYDADTLLDHIFLRLSTFEHSSSVNQENQFISRVIPSIRNLKLPFDISEMQRKLDNLLKEMESLSMIERVRKEVFEIDSTISFGLPDSSSTKSCFMDHKTMVGRTRDKENILHFLTRSEQNHFSVIPVVGMAGIGKTSLARFVYHDKQMSNWFQWIIWVSVTTDFDVVRIMRSMIEHLTFKPCTLSELDSLQATLQNILYARKFLLVLDDYWSETYEDWDILSSSFRFRSKGSRVILTTRSLKVSSIVNSSEAYTLGILSNDDCWELIKQTALLSPQASENLEPIRGQIAEKCQGLPLVAKTLGSMLRFKSSAMEWESISKTELWDMLEARKIFHSLAKSYLLLPPHLKRCFAYCSIFPKKHKYDVDELVLLWMGEGFIQPLGPNRLEDVGRHYFDELYSRSLFHLSVNTTPSQTIYEMPDLIHDMARLVSRDVCFHGTSDCYPLFGNICHLCVLHDSTQPLILKAYEKNERLRSFIIMCPNPESRGEFDDELFENCKSLRVLALKNLDITELPSSFDELNHLRYLDLSENPIPRLPECICKFVGLQTLKLRNCRELNQLPRNMKIMFNLRHLELDEECRLRLMPVDLGRLIGLQTLTLYVIGIGINRGHGIEELRDMNSLGGSLCIRNIQFVVNAVNAMEAKLDMKKYLTTLELQWTPLMDDSLARDQRMSEQVEVLKNLVPHTNLKEMVIKNYCGTIYPDWLSDRERKFTRIHLEVLKYCNKLPTLGELPYLKTFVISRMPSLESIDDEFFGRGDGVKFPSLESFELREMLALSEWKNESISGMPCLITFKIDGCPRLTSLPPTLLSRLPISEISGCPSLEDNLERYG
ncbi:hypothetical protein DH2020_014002 [Rehmannia glutinosa]|uniref:NB-ARC domain-containing protein n=1 Tax=Rehmannia glutinosa TaxID=99300 RepID=A0ABR0WV47_REHGL